ncbi:MAG: ATP-binding protein [Bacteroidales bacterium]|nr:ATP-binding protein [Bacteroidales bacterium]
MDLDRRVAFLKTVTIFSETPDSLLIKLSENLVEMEVSEGEQIVLKGELGDSMYIILDGRVKVHDGEYIFTVLKTGDVFGKYYLLDKKERSATVTALSHTFLLRFHQDVFYDITKNENSVIKGVLRALVGRLRDMNVIEEQLAAQNQEIIRQKEKLEEQKKELIELNTTKDKFFSIIAHDLRSPITTLITLSEILRTDLDLLTPEQTHEILSGLYDLSKNYLKLLDNLLQWSRIQTGRMEPSPEKFDISSLLVEVTNFYKITAVEKKVNLICTTDTPMFIFADKNMIKTVLRNLISNALKYTAIDGTVESGLIQKENGVEIYVKDTGLGMTSDQVSKLFRLDSTYSTLGTANEKGTGLGLILSQEFIDKNGGKIWVDSEKGVGSTFHVSLPQNG